MEELQSTEVLDREILEDARKKAARILKSCEDTIITRDADWKKKLYDAVREIDVQFEKNKKNETEIIMGRLPVDKQREKLNLLENILNCAVYEWYKNLSKEKIHDILSRELKKRTDSCKEYIEVSDKPILNESGKYPFITLENNKVKIIISMEKIIQELLEEKRYELIEALVGGEFLGEV